MSFTTINQGFPRLLETNQNNPSCSYDKIAGQSSKKGIQICICWQVGDVGVGGVCDVGVGGVGDVGVGGVGDVGVGGVGGGVVGGCCGVGDGGVDAFSGGLAKLEGKCLKILIQI